MWVKGPRAWGGSKPHKCGSPNLNLHMHGDKSEGMGCVWAGGGDITIKEIIILINMHTHTHPHLSLPTSKLDILSNTCPTDADTLHRLTLDHTLNHLTYPLILEAF